MNEITFVKVAIIQAKIEGCKAEIMTSEGDERYKYASRIWGFVDELETLLKEVTPREISKQIVS